MKTTKPSLFSHIDVRQGRQKRRGTRRREGTLRLRIYTNLCKCSRNENEKQKVEEEETQSVDNAFRSLVLPLAKDNKMINVCAEFGVLNNGR